MVGVYKAKVTIGKPLKSGFLYTILEELYPPAAGPDGIQYPSLIEQINCLKETYSLAHHLQRMEANIIVEGAGRLNFPKLLRHDQVLMYEENYNDVEKYLRAEYQKLGLEVHFK